MTRLETLLRLWFALTPGARAAAVAVLSALATTAIVLATVNQLLTREDHQRAVDFGSTLSIELAAMAVEPTIAGDIIRLSALATRVSRLPEVESVTFYNIDNQPLAAAGANPDTSTAHFTQPIVFEQAVAGYARLILREETFSTHLSAFWISALVLVSAGACALLGFFLGGREPTIPGPKEEPESHNIDEEAHPTDVFLLTVNLFNQISLPGNERQHVLGLCSERLKRICALYNGRSIDLPGTGLLLAFDDDGEPDRCFGVLCAALLAMEVLEDLNHGHLDALKPALVFRFGMHLGPDTEHLSDLADTNAARDSVVLSGVASSHTVAASTELFERLHRAERFVVETRRHPLLGTLSTSDHDECVIVRSLAESYRGLLDRQAALLTGQDPSTSSPSTF